MPPKAFSKASEKGFGSKVCCYNFPATATRLYSTMMAAMSHGYDNTKK